MRIQHNISALNSHRNLMGNNSAVGKNLEKLSSGYRINRAGDDAAGLAISEKMRAQITGLTTAQKNAEDGVSLVQTAEGALTEVHSMLNRMVELATQSANGTYEDKNRAEMQKEIVALRDEIDRISNTSNFNGKNLFVGGTSDNTTTTEVGITGPTDPSMVKNAGTGTDPLKYTVNLTGVAFENDGKVSVTLGGNTFDVEVTKGMAAEDFATAVATAYNNLTDKLDDTAGVGTFTADATAADGTITLTSTGNGTDIADADMKTAFNTDIAISEVATDKKTKAAEPAYAEGDTFTFDLSEAMKTPPVEDDEVAIGGVTFTFKDTPSADLQVEVGATAAESLDNLVAAINANDDLKEKFEASVKDGKLSLKALTDAEAGDAAPTLTAWDGADVEATVEKAEAEAAGDEVTVDLHVGETSNPNNTITVKIKSMSSASLGIDKLDISKQKDAREAIDVITAAIDSVSSIRSDLGAMQNRLEHTINNIGVQAENITAAESRIRDVDMAKEMMTYTKNNILVQASQAMLAQANQVPQGVLQLLQ